MRDYILSFCNEFGYPSEARQALLSAYDRLSENDAGFAIFCENVELYNKEALNNHDSALASLDQASEMSNVHRYTVHLLFYICLSRHTRELYKQKNIPDRIFYDSMSDLKWKLFECHNVYGIWGSFVASWFKRFFDLARFALGRLQFETIEFTREYSKNGYMLHPGDIVLNIHIPSCGPLTKEACLESYRKAASFF